MRLNLFSLTWINLGGKNGCHYLFCWLVKSKLMVVCDEWIWDYKTIWFCFRVEHKSVSIKNPSIQRYWSFQTMRWEWMWDLRRLEALCYKQYYHFLFVLWIRKIPWRRKWQPTSVPLSEKPHGQRSLAGYNPKVTKNWTQLSEHNICAIMV